MDDASSMDEKKKLILEVLFRQNVLENIRFFVSFLYTFKINELNDQIMQGSVNNIKLILNDEIIHTTIFRHIINILRKNEDEGFSHLFTDEMKEFAVQCFEEVIENEIEWHQYLSSIQPIPGLSDSEIEGFLRYYSTYALAYTGMVSKSSIPDMNDTVKYFESKKDLNNSKALAQETNLLTYNIGVLEDNGVMEKENIAINVEDYL
jgi:ribonucleotide reductase beta subunit family protein with ferritin-like domain